MLCRGLQCFRWHCTIKHFLITHACRNLQLCMHAACTVSGQVWSVGFVAEGWKSFEKVKDHIFGKTRAGAPCQTCCQVCPPKLPNLVPDPPSVQPNLLPRWQPSLQPNLQLESPFLWPLLRICGPLR